MSDKAYERQNPVYYALLVALIFMSVGPIILMFANSFKLDVDITSGTGGLLFIPTIQNYETALCDVLWYEPEHLDFCQLKFGGAFINSLIISLISISNMLSFPSHSNFWNNLTNLHLRTPSSNLRKHRLTLHS